MEGIVRDELKLQLEKIGELELDDKKAAFLIGELVSLIDFLEADDLDDMSEDEEEDEDSEDSWKPVSKKVKK